MEAELCPLDDRRSASEVSLKLAVVHFTTITAYCHLLSVRGEPTGLICIKAVLFLLCPVSIIIQHVLAVLVVVGAYVLVRFEIPRDPRPLQSSLRRAPFIFFGRIDPSHSKSRLRSSEGDSVVKSIGRVIAVLALTVQCIGSCVIFARRRERGAVTLADWRVLEFATASLLVSMLTVAYLLWGPALRLSPRETIALADSSRRTYLDTALLYLRHVPAPTEADLPDDKWTQFRRHFPRLVFSSTIIFGVFCVQPWTSGMALASVKPLFFSGGMIRELRIFGSRHTECDGCVTGFFSNCIASIFQSVFLTLSICLATTIYMREARDYSYQVLRIRPRQVVLRRVAVIPIGIVVWGLIFHTMFFCLSVFSPPWDIYMFVSQTKEMVEQLVMLAAWPTDRECPLLWSDPKANVLWHLM